MTQPDLVRPNYRENQQLRVEDLDTEQAYLIATRRRHDSTAHAPGVAHGLGLAPLDAGLNIAAGLAVDDLGRAVVLPDLVLLRWPDLPTGAPALDLFVSYREEEVADRVTEGADVHVSAVRPTDGVAGPAHSVYLGRLVANPGGPLPYLPTASRIDFATATGATVAAETGETILLAADPAVTVAVPDPAGRSVSRLAVSPTSGTAVNGAVAAGQVELTGTNGLRFGAPVPAPPAAAPWRWYHAEILADGVLTGQQLRVELGGPSSNDLPDWFRFAVHDGAGTFPLTVDAGGTTTVGSLSVTGTLVFGPLDADPTDPRLLATLTQTWTGAVDQVSKAVDKQFSGDLFDTSALTVTVSVPPAPQVVVPPPPLALTYRVTVANGLPQPVTDLTVAAVNTINGAQSSERLVRLDTPLVKGSPYTFSHTVSVPDQPGLVVHVEVVALGLLPGGKVTLGLTNFDWTVPSQPGPVASPRTRRFLRR